MRTRRLFFACILGSVLAATGRGATTLAWPSSGASLAAPGSEFNVHAVLADGQGGMFAAIVAHGATFGQAQLRAQRLDPSGARLWGDAGATLTSALGDPYCSAISGDGAGGVFVAWGDETASPPGTWVQRVDTDGARPWAATLPEGRLLPGSEYPTPAALIGHPDGGVVAFWSRELDEIRAQRIGLDGTAGWGPDGVVVCSDPGGRRYPPRVLPDGAGGAFVCWVDSRFASGWWEYEKEVFVQRVGSDGAVAAGWPADGLSVCATHERRRNPQLVPDAQGGVLVVWQDSRGGDGFMDEDGYEEAMTVWGQRIAPDGVRLWDDDGRQLFAGQTRVSEVWEESGLVVSPDGTGGALVVWEAYVPLTDQAVLAAQRFDPAGAAAFASPVAIESTPAWRRDWSGAPDGAGGAFVVWGFESTYGASDRIRGQHVTADGSLLWGADGAPFGVKEQGVAWATRPIAAADGAGGAFVAWNSSQEPRAQHVVGSGADTLVQGFLLPTSVRRKMARRPGSWDTLTWKGILDTGTESARFSGSSTAWVGGVRVTLPPFSPERGGKLKSRSGPVDVTLEPRSGGGSRCEATVRLKGSDVAKVGPDDPVTVRFATSDLDIACTCTLSSGRYAIGTGGVAEGVILPLSFRATLAGAGRDSFTATFAVPQGDPDGPVPDVRIAVGPAYDVTLPGTSFRRVGPLWSAAAAGGRPAVTFDPRRGLVTVKAKKASLGEFAAGAQTVRLVMGPEDPAVIDVRMVRKGKSLVW